MSIVGNPRKWLAAGALTLAMCAFSVAQPERGKHPGKGGGSDKEGCHTSNCVQVPDGGSSVGYLFAVGAVCVGALLLHSRRQNSLPS